MLPSQVPSMQNAREFENKIFYMLDFLQGLRYIAMKAHKNVEEEGHHESFRDTSSERQYPFHDHT